MLKIGTTRKERCGDWVRTLQVVCYNASNTHEVWEVIREVYNPIDMDYVSLTTPKRFDYS